MASARPMPDFVRTPRSLRRACDTPVLLVDETGCEMIGRMGNISDRGFMVDCDTPMRVGAIVTVTLPGRRRVQAEIRWVVGQRFGARFLAD